MDYQKNIFILIQYQNVIILFLLIINQLINQNQNVYHIVYVNYQK